MSLFGSSGIRGKVGKEITIDLVTRIGVAVGSEYKDIIIGQDTRTTADMMRSALVAGATSMGADVHMAGLVSTPTLARAAEEFHCGLMITASHNPPDYNGVKMWNPDGSAFDGQQTELIEARIERGVAERPNWQGVGNCHHYESAVEKHIEAIKNSIGPMEVDVIVDCGCGATCGITPRLLRELGCRVTTLNSQPDGHFPGRLPEPNAEHLGDLFDLMGTRGADLGIAHDGDGDRMVAVDESGRFVGGDELLALFASNFEGSIAAPINASMVLDELASGDVIRTMVGDVHVSQALKREGLGFGGEPSGTFIFSEQTYCPDGVYAAALLASMVSERPLSEMVDELPSYPVSRGSVDYKAERKEEVADRLAEEMGTVECDRLLTLDGYRAEFEEGWFLIRLSGTEPKIRITVEARNEDYLEKLMGKATDIARGCIS